MRLKALMALAAAVSLASGLAYAADPGTDQWLSIAKQQVEKRLAAAGLGQGDTLVAVQMTIDGEGELYHPQIVSGVQSLDEAAAIQKAIRRVQVESPPAVLSGRTVTFHFGLAPVQTAGMPQKTTP
ncbi:MAG: hypothetical protein ACHP84_13610 [Caulobacterales bacterium]